MLNIVRSKIMKVERAVLYFAFLAVARTTGVGTNANFPM